MSEERIYINKLVNYKNKEVVIKGWVNAHRNQGKMVFLDFRDITGIVQGIILPGSQAIELGQSLKAEYVVQVKGRVNERPEKQKKEGILNGDIELEVLEIKVLNTVEVLPFQINDTSLVDENLRLQYRYLDLRSERLQKNIKNRSKLLKFVRDFLYQEGFFEIETPLMSAPTPEGSRSFVVPSRVWPGNFFSLPQSPQQYKQLLMVAGFEKYFQFAKCMRDEDPRGDRQPEFTQLDLEMSFVTKEEVMALNEKLLIELIKNNYPEKKIQQIPFPCISYQAAMEQYGNDKPDIREDKNDPNLLAFLWVTDFPMFEKVDADNNIDGVAEWTYTHNPFSRPKDEFMADFMAQKNIGNILTTQYDITLNGFEIGGGSLRNHKSEALKKTFEIMGYDEARIESNFGHMLRALEFGAPPHGGIAWGFDRLLMILENEPNIREVIPFAKTSEGKDVMMNAPCDISEKQKQELKITILKDDKKNKL
ncbi:MAG: aspartyl-tRNA synthetase [Patescibacteria group bacterium]|nr:aspartyl-tRNA synthetase [Patescibacteria group bacterium]